MSSFFQSKPERDTKTEAAAPAPRQPAATGQVSTLAAGLQVAGNIVCAGPLQIHGRVKGDIHATQLTICEGAIVDGKVVAQEAVIQGRFNGIVNGNSVKLSKTARVDGEIFSKSLSIEQDAQFEGVSRKLDKAIEIPAAPQANGEKLMPTLQPDTEPASPAVN